MKKVAASRIIYCLSSNSLFFSSRAEVSSSSSLDSPVQSAQQVSVQVLLHSQCLQTSEQGQRDCEILSSQQDLFETDKTGKCMQTCSGWGCFFHSTMDHFLFLLPVLLSVVGDDQSDHPAAELHMKYAKVRLLQDDSCFHGYLPIIANLVLLSL